MRKDRLALSSARKSADRRHPGGAGSGGWRAGPPDRRGRRSGGFAGGSCDHCVAALRFAQSGALQPEASPRRLQRRLRLRLGAAAGAAPVEGARFAGAPQSANLRAGGAGRSSARGSGGACAENTRHRFDPRSRGARSRRSARGRPMGGVAWRVRGHMVRRDPVSCFREPRLRGRAAPPFARRPAGRARAAADRGRRPPAGIAGALAEGRRDPGARPLFRRAFLGPRPQGAVRGPRPRSGIPKGIRKKPLKKPLKDAQNSCLALRA